MENKYTKLSELVGSTFTVKSVGLPVFKMWDNDARKMLVSDDWQKGYRKVYPLETDKGKLDLGSGQIGNLLEAVFHNGSADIKGVAYEVKSNGKTGKDIRYFFNAQRIALQESDEFGEEDTPSFEDLQ